MKDRNKYMIRLRFATFKSRISSVHAILFFNSKENELSTAGQLMVTCLAFAHQSWQTCFEREIIANRKLQHLQIDSAIFINGQLVYNFCHFFCGVMWLFGRIGRRFYFQPWHGFGVAAILPSGPMPELKLGFWLIIQLPLRWTRSGPALTSTLERCPPWREMK